MAGSPTPLEGKSPEVSPSTPPKTRPIKHALDKVLSRAAWTAMVLGGVGLLVYLPVKNRGYFVASDHVDVLLGIKGALASVCGVAAILSAWRILLRTEKHQRDYAKFMGVICGAIGIWIAIMLPTTPHISEQEIADLRNANAIVAEPHISLSDALKQIARGAELSRSDVFTRAQGELGLEHYPEAIRDLELGARPLTASLADAHFYKARALLVWSRYDPSKYGEALSEAQLSLILRPNYASALVIECSSFRNLNSRKNYLADAAKACEAAVAAAPKDAEVYNAMGGVLIDQKKYEDAITNFDTGISLDPRMPQLWSNRAVARHKMAKGSSDPIRQNEIALDDVQKALGLAPQFTDALLNKGTILKALNRKEEALRLYEQMTRDDPTDAYAWSNLGDSIEAESPKDPATLRDALSKFNRAVQIDPRFEDAWFDRGDAQLELGEYKEAAESLGVACKLNDGTDVDAWSELAVALSKEGKKNEAVVVAKHTLKLRPSDKAAKRIIAGLQP
jgi:tetratricopeptide (TPR) repeat protein